MVAGGLDEAEPQPPETPECRAETRGGAVLARFGPKGSRDLAPGEGPVTQGQERDQSLSAGGNPHDHPVTAKFEPIEEPDLDRSGTGVGKGDGGGPNHGKRHQGHPFGSGGAVGSPLRGDQPSGPAARGPRGSLRVRAWWGPALTNRR